MADNGDNGDCAGLGSSGVSPSSALPRRCCLPPMPPAARRTTPSPIGACSFEFPDFFDVASNVAFLIGGAIGLIVTFHPRTRFEFPRERWLCDFLLGRGADCAWIELLPSRA